MSFSPSCGAVRICKTYSQNLHPEMSVITENTINASKARTAKKPAKPSVERVSRGGATVGNQEDPGTPL